MQGLESFIETRLACSSLALQLVSGNVDVNVTRSDCVQVRKVRARCKHTALHWYLVAPWLLFYDYTRKLCSQKHDGWEREILYDEIRW